MFRRSLQLPQEVDEDDVSARFEDGVLEVVIEGAAEGRSPNTCRSRAAMVVAVSPSRRRATETSSAREARS